MLRKRLITTLLFNNGVLFRTKQFVPDYRYTFNFVDTWSVDEIVLLDITRPEQANRAAFLEILELFATKAFVPIAVGGHIRSIEDIQRLLNHGADKISLNTYSHENPEFLTQAAQKFGNQCIVASIDAKKQEDGTYHVFSNCGRTDTGKDPVSWAKEVEARGVGEILLTSMDKDGSLEGYDNELNHQVTQAVQIPIIVSGGAGKWQDFVDGFKEGNASAVATSNIYHFTETSIRSAKQFLDKRGIAVRT